MAVAGSPPRLALARAGLTVVQINSAREVTLPKNGRIRDALLTPPARDALVALRQQSGYGFVNLRGGHVTPSGRAYHWRSIRQPRYTEATCTLATRHFAGSFITSLSVSLVLVDGRGRLWTNAVPERARPSFLAGTGSVSAVGHASALHNYSGVGSRPSDGSAGSGFS